jgi:acyl-CoA thioester hydrolase
VTTFCWRARVYWEDTDGGGVVYYANYLKYLERARTEWLRAHGVSQQALARERGIVFAVASARIDYRRPARLDDELLVSCEPRAEGAASVSFQQSIHRCTPASAAPGTQVLPAPERGELLVTAEVRVACVDAQTFRPQRLPAFMADALAAQKSA